MSKTWKWIKKNWKILLKVAIFLGGAFLVLKVRKAIIGKVSKPINFFPDSSDDSIIHIKSGEKYVPFKLPLNIEGKQMKAKDVEAAGRSESNTIVVEAKHEKVDRRNVSSIDNGALDSLGLSGDNDGS